MISRIVAKFDWPLTRLLQFLLDPFVVFLPGAATLAQRVGLSADTPAFVSPQRLDHGLVLVLPGIEGPSFYSRAIRTGLASLPAAVSMCNWSGFWPGAVAALSMTHRQRRVGALIQAISKYREVYPGRPVIMVGHSGGAAMSIATSERLGPAAPLDGIVAMATPLHPTYDLSRALAGTRRLLTCHSRADYQLRALTCIAGNFDRQFGRTAGQEGFDFPQHDRLTQLPWERAMAKFNHSGGHVGCAAPRWVRRFIAPAVRQWLQEQ